MVATIQVEDVVEAVKQDPTLIPPCTYYDRENVFNPVNVAEHMIGGADEHFSNASESIAGNISPEDNAKFIQSLAVARTVDPENGRLQDAIEAAWEAGFGMTADAFRAGVRAGAAAEHVRLGFSTSPNRLCPACHGRGLDHDGTCEPCNGTGFIPRPERDYAAAVTPIRPESADSDYEDRQRAIDLVTGPWEKSHPNMAHIVRAVIGDKTPIGQCCNWYKADISPDEERVLFQYWTTLMAQGMVRGVERTDEPTPIVVTKRDIGEMDVVLTGTVYRTDSEIEDENHSRRFSVHAGMMLHSDDSGHLNIRDRSSGTSIVIALPSPVAGQIWGAAFACADGPPRGVPAPVHCPACNADEANADGERGCSLCHGCGFVRAETAKRFRVSAAASIKHEPVAAEAA